MISLAVSGEERFDLGSQFSIRSAGRVQKSGAAFRRERQRLVKHLFRLLVTIRCFHETTIPD